MRCFELCGSDTRIDCATSFSDPINPLAVWCGTCGFPDLDDVAEPYEILKGRAMTSNEVALAAYGNLLVRPRVRRVLEVTVPGACAFYPTTFRKQTGVSPWSLAVPRQQVPTGIVRADIPRCPSCGQPRSSHPGSQWDRRLLGRPFDAPHDLFKAATWASSESGWHKRLSRDVFMSSRLYGLFERLGVRGVVPTSGSDDGRKQRQAAFKGWIDGQMAAIDAAGIAPVPQGKMSADVARRFKRFLSQTADVDAPVPFDRRSAERAIGSKLPPSVVDYFTATSRRLYHGVDDQPGVRVELLPIDEWDLTTYRHAATEGDGEPGIDGVMFATTDYGDCYCLDLANGTKEPAVYQYLHEGCYFEPYADSFAECVLRFAAGD